MRHNFSLDFFCPLIFIRSFNLFVPVFRNDSLAGEIEEMFPKTYHADEISIVLENITKLGFKMISKADRQDFQHARYEMSSGLQSYFLYKSPIQLYSN